MPSLQVGRASQGCSNEEELEKELVESRAAEERLERDLTQARRSEDLIRDQLQAAEQQNEELAAKSAEIKELTERLQKETSLREETQVDLQKKISDLTSASAENTDLAERLQKETSLRVEKEKEVIAHVKERAAAEKERVQDHRLLLFNHRQLISWEERKTLSDMLDKAVASMRRGFAKIEFLQASASQAYRHLLSTATETVEIIRQKKASLSCPASPRNLWRDGQPFTCLSFRGLAYGSEMAVVEEQLSTQQTMAARLSAEEKALKVQLKRLRAAAGTEDTRREEHAARTSKAAGRPSQPSHGKVPSADLQQMAAAASAAEGQLPVDDVEHDSDEDLDGEAAGDGAPQSPAKDSKRRRKISRQEAANPDDALAQQLKDNAALSQELEALRKQLQDLKNAASAEVATGTGSLSPTRARRNSRVHISEPSGESAGDASASPSARSRSRRSSSRRSVSAAARRSSAKPAEEAPVSEEQRQENEVKLKDLIAACQKLAEEKEAFEKELASIEDKIRRVKSMDSGGAVALLKQDVQQEKKVESSEVKELKAEIKKKTSQVNAMRRTWQEMQGSNKRGSASAAVEEERQREVAKRFAHVLSFLRAAKAAELSKEAENAGLVTESGNAEVVGRSASKFLLSIRKDKMEAKLTENIKAQEPAPPASPVGQRRPSITRNALIAPSPLASPVASPVLTPTPDEQGTSRQGFNRIMAEAMTGHRSSIAGPQHSATSSDDESVSRPSRRVSASSSSLQVPRTSDDGEVRRRSFNNILEKARMRKPKEEVVLSPGAKANAAVRFASDG
ncbi:unnamed protein product [Symbiodinium pilosum]|uniref:Uncharacterized protein n=1 Tax=Symbiodinium pilosum TaxID=2952 RepID=A0A812WQX7_SYMPI|nr:unnamed protein product [Symbiodinium pilosum]